MRKTYVAAFFFVVISENLFWVFDQVSYVLSNVTMCLHSMHIVLLSDVYLVMMLNSVNLVMVVVVMRLFRLRFDWDDEILSVMMEYQAPMNLDYLMIVAVDLNKLRAFSFGFQPRLLMFHRLDR